MKQWWTLAALALGLLMNDFIELEEGGARLPWFLQFIWLVKALPPILPMSNILQQ